MVDSSRDTDQFWNWLFEQNSEGALHWLDEIWEGSRQAPEQVNWLLLAEISPNLALQQDDLGWAHLGILVNTFLISTIRTCGQTFSSARMIPPEQRVWACSGPERRILSLRVRFLLQRGHLSGNPVLDRNQLIPSFLSGLTLSFEEALKQWNTGEKEPDRERSGQLHRISW